MLLLLLYVNNTAYIPYGVNYSGQTSYVSNYFYFLFDQKDCYMMVSTTRLLAIAKFLVSIQTFC